MPFLERHNQVVTGKDYRELAESQYWPRERIEQLEAEKLSRLVKHAYENTTLYRLKFKNIGLHPNDIRKIDDVKHLPVITRDDLNGHLEEMIAQNIPRSRIHFDATGGSTGLRTHFVRDNDCLGVKKASEYRFNSWTGWKPGEKILYYWPALTDFAKGYKKPNVFRERLIGRQLRLYSGRLNEIILAEHMKAFLSFKPDLIRCFPNSLQIFAEYALGKGITFEIKRGVICVGEPLNGHHRLLFKKVFNCEVYNCYVSRECGNTACECDAHNGMHVSDELLFLEVETDERSGVGRILITDLYNMGMPLIRYDIQDASKLIEGECVCGRKLTRIGLDAARITDYLVSPKDGSIISGSTLVHYLLAEGPKVGRVKLIQDAPNHILVQLCHEYEKEREGIQQIKDKLDTIFQGSVRVEFMFVDDIPFMNSGKYRFVERLFR